MKYFYVINKIPPSLNAFMGRGNVWSYRETKKQWAWVMNAAIGKNVPKKPLAKALVKITYYFPTKARHDPDNYTPKLIMDPLVQSGVIVDDSFACVELVLCGGHDKLRPRTEIEVSEVEKCS